MKLNSFQLGWLKRIEATPAGVLRVIGTRQMNPASRDYMHDSGLIRFLRIPSLSTEPQSFVYTITEGGRAALEKQKPPAERMPEGGFDATDSIAGLL